MNLTIIQENNQLLVDSREVAAMIGKRHADLIRDIDGYKLILDQNAKLRSDDFFIESHYKAGTGKPYKCYKLTKQGCEMVANKLTGEKGILFTATYVSRFNEMESREKHQNQLPTNFKEALLMLVEQVEKTEQLETKNLVLTQQNNELQPKASYYDLVLQNKSLLTVSKIAKDYGMSAVTLNRKLHDLGVQYKQGDIWLLYAKYQDKGYTQTTTHVIDADNSKVNTKWTQKGRLFIYDLLKQEGILPMIEREEKEVI